jgi:hypothetical protein
VRDCNLVIVVMIKSNHRFPTQAKIDLMIFIRRETLSVVKSQTNETKQLKPLTVTYYNATTTTTTTTTTNKYVQSSSYDSVNTIFTLSIDTVTTTSATSTNNNNPLKRKLNKLSNEEPSMIEDECVENSITSVEPPFKARRQNGPQINVIRKLKRPFARMEPSEEEIDDDGLITRSNEPLAKKVAVSNHIITPCIQNAKNLLAIDIQDNTSQEDDPLGMNTVENMIPEDIINGPFDLNDEEQTIAEEIVEYNSNYTWWDEPEEHQIFDELNQSTIISNDTVITKTLADPVASSSPYDDQYYSDAEDSAYDKNAKNLLTINVIDNGDQQEDDPLGMNTMESMIAEEIVEYNNNTWWNEPEEFQSSDELNQSTIISNEVEPTASSSPIDDQCYSNSDDSDYESLLYEPELNRLESLVVSPNSMNEADLNYANLHGSSSLLPVDFISVPPMEVNGILETITQSGLRYFDIRESISKEVKKQKDAEMTDDEPEEFNSWDKLNQDTIISNEVESTASPSPYDDQYSSDSDDTDYDPWLYEQELNKLESSSQDTVINYIPDSTTTPSATTSIPQHQDMQDLYIQSDDSVAKAWKQLEDWDNIHQSKQPATRPSIDDTFSYSDIIWKSGNSDDNQRDSHAQREQVSPKGMNEADLNYDNMYDSSSLLPLDFISVPPMEIDGTLATIIQSGSRYFNFRESISKEARMQKDAEMNDGEKDADSSRFGSWCT